MVPITNPQLARKNAILKGYAAFNDGDRDTLKELLHPDVVWHKMHDDGDIEGREEVLDYLLNELRAQGTEAEFLGVASQGNVSITVDYTYDGPEGDHACADRILFDASGCITAVWHCKAASHEDGQTEHHAGENPSSP